MSSQEWKEKGNAHLKNKNYIEALQCYSEAINHDPNDHIHYSNRSVCYFNMDQFEKAIEDADKCISLKPHWSKGYLRKGMAEFKIDKVEESIETYKKGLELEPTNQQLKENLKEAEDVNNNPMAKNFSKLYTDPRTSKYMTDPQFQTLLQYAMKDQKTLMQLVQTDPRFMDVFSVLTGIDLNMMNEESQKMKKQKDEENKVRQQKDAEERVKEEENKKKKQDEEKWSHMTEEEKQKQIKITTAEELKTKGNEEFKKKNWEGALAYYNEAINTNPDELALYLNRAGVYHNMQQFEKTIEDANYVANHTFDFQKKAKAFGKIGYAYLEQNNFDKAIEAFDQSLLETTDQRIKDSLRDVKATKRCRRKSQRRRKQKEKTR